jgi:hypothetical protein
MTSMGEFVRDPDHWLRRFSPEEWIRAGLTELRRAEAAYKANSARAGLAGCKRAAGMALNAALIVEPNDAWGRSYVDHLLALGADDRAPSAVREACGLLLKEPPNARLVSLRSRASDEKVIESTKDLIAHAYAIVARHSANAS